MSLQTPLSKAKGLGSIKSGSSHWLMQRITAIALIPAIIWFIFSLVNASKSGTGLQGMISSPCHAVFLALFITVSLYHGYIGIKVVLEDYVHCVWLRFLSIVFISFVTVLLWAGTILAIIKGHIEYSKPKHSLAISNEVIINLSLSEYNNIYMS